MNGDLVCVENIKVHFDGFKALDVDYFGVKENELRVVIGPNGAGKTTLCDVISGKTKVSEGKVFFSERETTHASESEISAMGVGRKFQTPTVFDSLTVFENMELAAPGRRRVYQNLFGKVSSETRDRIMSTLERVGLSHMADVKSKHLSHGQRQWLEISMLIVQSPKLLLVDEPAAGLTDEETHLTGELLLELAGSHTLMVIEHDMEFVRQLNKTVTVLCEGKVLCEGPLEKVQADERVIEAYLGR
ncbi:MAG TPA: urea ABC transporter ATP-binding protein UrtD [Planctomycetota bacterium]|nr:urea ABC transporter ATP-binding protein UrtD [Planctomycetota bacterium]